MKVATDTMVLALGKLLVSPVPEKNLLCLEEALVVRYQWEGYVKGFVIPRGFTYDGASIPILRSDFQPMFLRAAAVHDWCCELWNNREEVPVDFTVEEMSELFGEILKIDGVSYLRAETMEMAVTAFKSVF